MPLALRIFPELPALLLLEAPMPPAFTGVPPPAAGAMAAGAPLPLVLPGFAALAGSLKARSREEDAPTVVVPPP